MNFVNVTDVIIRKMSYLKTKDERLIDVFVDANAAINKLDKAIPIVYQYAETKGFKKHSPMDMMGYVVKFYKKSVADEEYLLCEVRLDTDSTYYEQFMNFIDNYTIKTEPDGSMELTRLIIYDKELKEQVNKERIKRMEERIQTIQEAVSKEHDRHGQFKRLKPGTKFDFK